MRKGLGIGKGRGYFNLVKLDSHIHSLSAKGVKSYDPKAYFNKEVKKENLKINLDLPIQTAILVPSTKEKDKPISREEFANRVETTRDELYHLFGGFTSVTGFGGSENKKTKEIIKERVNVVVAYAGNKDFKEKADEFIEYIKNKKKEWGQQEIGVIIENDLFYI